MELHKQTFQARHTLLLVPVGVAALETANTSMTVQNNCSLKVTVCIHGASITARARRDRLPLSLSRLHLFLPPPAAPVCFFFAKRNLPQGALLLLAVCRRVRGIALTGPFEGGRGGGDHVEKSTLF